MLLEYVNGAGRCVPQEQAHLLTALCAGHQHAALRDNASSMAVRMSAGGSGDFGKAVIAGIAMLGSLHGPITAAREAIFHIPHQDLEAAILGGVRIPGWGSSFVKVGPDPAFQEVAELISGHHQEQQAALDRITQALHKHGRRVFPNAAAYTAVVADLVALPFGTELSLFLAARLPVWAGIFEKGRR